MSSFRFLGQLFLFLIVLSSQVYGQALSGTYTINSAGSGSRNFTSFQNASISLSVNGISGAVVFQVASGTYAGPVTFKEVKGASTKQTITFKSPGVDSSQITINGTRAAITLDGADFYRFEAIDINDTEGRGMGILFTGGADSNVIKKCRIRVSGVMDNGTHIVMGSIDKGQLVGENSGNANLISNCVMTRGNSAFKILGDTVKHCYGNQLVGNSMRVSKTGIEAFHQDQLLIDSNVVTSIGPALDNVLLAKHCNSIRIEFNRFLSGNITLIDAGYRTGASMGPSRAFNNMCFLTGSLIIRQCDDFIFWHNSLYSNESKTLSLENTKGLDIRNNIVFYDGIDYALVADSNCSFSKFDYNNLWSARGNVAFINGKRYSTIIALKSYHKAFNQNNWAKNPDFVSLAGRNLRLGSKFPSLFAPYLGIDKDIDGDTRCTIQATIGCDEASHSIFPPRANFGVSDTLWKGSNSVAINGASPNTASRVFWFINGKFITDSFHMEYVPTRLGYDTISMRIETCSGADTLSKRVFVQSALAPPVADFLSSSTKSLIGETISLVDLSTGGPSQWEWSVHPETAYNYVTQKAEPTYAWEFKKSPLKANPKLTFLLPGSYDVQLKAINGIGQDSLIKQSLVEVIDQLEMCGQKLSTANEGVLLDDGGLKGYYNYPPTGKGQLCTATLSTCEGILEFNIEELKLGTRTYLRIYDGLDTSGTPLWNIKEGARGMVRDTNHASVIQNFKALSGNAYIEFEKDVYASIDIGFRIHWQVKQTLKPLPSALFEATDTACTGFNTSFQNLSSGNYSSIAWDLDADGTVESTDWHFSHEFKSPGNRKVALYVFSNCALTDTFEKELVVENSSSAPRPMVHASSKLVEVYDTVYLSANSAYCHQSTKWSISPATYTLLDGGKLSHEYIAVVFTKGGEYDVSVTMTNNIGSNTTSHKKFIRVVEYCEPTVSLLNTSVAISKVILGDHEHSSDVGKQAYTHMDKKPMLLRTDFTYPIEIHRKNTSSIMTRKVWIDWNFDGDFDDRDELVASEGPANTLVLKDSITVPYHVKSTTTRMRVGVSFGTLKNTACGPNQIGEYEDYNVTINDSDIRAPKLTLQGRLRDTIAVFENWNEPGYRAWDERWGNVGKDVKVNGKVYSKGVGSYTLSYEIEDSSGNKAIATRTIIVVDSLPPTISLIGFDSVQLQAGYSFADPGASVNDNYDKQWTVLRTGKLDSSILGMYSLKYCVTDSSGNGPSCVTRWVRVIDTIPPVISLRGGSSTAVDVFSNYIDPGYTVVEGTTYTVSTSGSWQDKTDVLGQFERIYTAEDAAGNKHSVTRKIEVVDRVAPIIELIGAGSVTIPRWSTYADSGVRVSDNYFSDTAITVDTAGTFNGSQNLGIYSLDYTASDPKGNKSTVSRIIIVEETGTGIDESKGFYVKAYPNPTLGNLFIDLPSGIKSNTLLVLYNDLGQEVMAHELGQGAYRHILQLEHLPTGLYLLEAETATERYSQLIQKR